MRCVIGVSHGSTSSTPINRTSRLPSGRRRASGVEAWTRGGRAPPRLAPSTSARVSGAPITWLAESEPMTSTMATLEWQPQVNIAASSTASSGSVASD